jgi:hypothetical protein
MVPNALITIGIVIAIATVAGVVVSRGMLREDPWQDKNLLNSGKNLPIVWIYYDESDVNSRYWADFGARSNRVLNVPYLNLCYESIVRATAPEYRVEVINGLTDLSHRLGGWDEMPTLLQNPLASVGESELNWIRAAVLAKWGGLWVAPSTIWLHHLGPLPKDKTVFFGMDDETPYADKFGTGTPGLRVVWAPKPALPLWTAWETAARTRLDKMGGGRQIRHDDYSDAFLAISQNPAQVELRPWAERSRMSGAGKRIQIEDILSNGIMPFDITNNNLYVPVPWPELRDRSAFGWFLRMNEDQIMESDLAITELFKRSRVTTPAAQAVTKKIDVTV